MEEKKFVQIRFETNKSAKCLGMLKHNTRTLKPSYLRDNMAHNKENNSIIIDSQIIDINDKNKRKIYFNIKKEIQEYEELLKKENRSFRLKKHATTIDSIITLSNSINKMYEEKKITKKELDSYFLKAIKKIETEIGLSAIYGVVHYDEKTPHLHICFQNYYKNNEKWQGMAAKIKKHYSSSQDVVGEVFKPIGFARGVKGSKKKHLSVQQMHEEEQKEIKEKFELQVDFKKKKVQTLEKYKNIKNIISIREENPLFGDKFYKITEEELKRLNNYIKCTYSVVDELKKGYINNQNNVIENLTKSRILREKEEKLKREEEEIKKEKNNYIQYKDFYHQYKNITQNYKSISLENEKIKKELEREKQTNEQLYNKVNGLRNDIKKLNNVIYKYAPDYYNNLGC